MVVFSLAPLQVEKVKQAQQPYKDAEQKAQLQVSQYLELGMCESC